MAEAFKNEELVIGLETAIGGGSISILRGAAEIDRWVGTDKLSGSTHVLGAIAWLLEKNDLRRDQIGGIAVGVGLGSLTGIRIGLGIAAGICRGLGACLHRVPVLEALAGKRLSGEKVLVAVAVNRREVGWQILANEDDFGENHTGLKIESASDFKARLDKLIYLADRFVLDQNVFETVCASERTYGGKIINAGKNLAFLIGRWNYYHIASDNDVEIYHNQQNFKKIQS